MRWSLIAVLLMILAVPLTAEVTEDNQIVQGVYRSKLIEYDENGKYEREWPITDAEIAGTPVLDKSRRGLVKIHFENEDRWFRASHLKLSVPITPDCPQSAPGRSGDRTSPTSSGMGADCNQ